MVTQVIAAEPIRLAFKDTTVMKGSTFLYPVMVDSSLTGYNVTSYELDITYDVNSFSIDSILVGGSLTESWGTPTYNINSGHIVIAGAGTTELSGTGNLLFLKISAPISLGGWGSGFYFQKAMLNEGSPTTTIRNGTVWISSPPYITVYPDVATTSVGEQIAFWISGGQVPYQWSVTNPTVASIDTNGVLTGLSGGYTRVVGRDNRSIVDTSGQIEVHAFKMTIRDTSLLQGQTFNIPIYVSDLSQIDVTSGQFWITYDPNMLSYLEDVETGTLLSSYPKPTIRAISNRLEISFAGSSRLNGVGTQVLMYLRFKATVQYTGGSWLNISNLLFNESFLGVVDDGWVGVSNRTVLTLTPNSGDILVGDTIQFTVGGSPSGPVTWSLNDSTLASITQTGLLTALKSGTVVVGVADTIGKIGFSQNINIYDIRLSMPDSSALSRDSIILPISITQYLPGFTSVQMIVKFDTTYFENPSIITEGTLVNGLPVYSFARGETLSVASANSAPITGPGVLFRVKFFVRYGAPKLSTSTIRMVGVVFNEGIPRPLIEDCSFYIRWERDVRVVDILEPVGIISRDSVVTPRVRVQNVRDITQMFKVTFRIGNLYYDTVNVMLGAWGTMDLTFTKSWSAAPTGTHVLKCEAILDKDQDTSNNVLTRNLAVIRTSEDPIILSMTPDYGGNEGVVTSIIHGLHFKTGATVRLSNNGYPDYLVDTAYVRVLDPTKIMVVFDFYSQPLGTWNVEVMNPDSGSTIFYDGFTIENPSKRLWATIVGQDRIRIGREQPYTVMFGNVGNIDGVGVLLLIRGVPRNVEWTMDFAFAPSPVPDSIDWTRGLGIIETETEKIIPIWLPLLHANETRQISFRIKVPWGTPRFTLSAGILESQNHLYVPSALAQAIAGGRLPAGYLGTQDINWACVTAIGTLIGNVVGVFIPNECISLGINTFTTIASIIASDSFDGYNYVQTISSTVKDALFCAGYALGGPIATAIKVASIITDLIASGVDIYQKCFPDPDNQLPIQPVAAVDPNHKSGPAGYDTTSHYTTGDQPFMYMVEFENLASATAEAETIYVRDTLDANLDWSTLQFQGSSHPQYLTTITDQASRSITWTFGGINLPPNVNPPEGQGWALFSIEPMEGLATGTQITNSASIVFDYNPPIVTNLFLNTIDTGKPNSYVFALPETTATGEFTVQWTGVDDSLGSGIGSYDIYVKYDTGAYVPWLIGTTDTMATFVGDNERVHSFYSIAIDNVGLREDSPLSPDAVTWVAGVAPPMYLTPADDYATSDPKPVFKWTPTAGNLGTYILQYSPDSLFLSNVQSITGITDTIYTLTDSLIDGEYFWCVEAVSRSSSHSGYRSPFRLTIDTQAPETPTLLSLADGAIIKVANPAFAWTSVVDKGIKYFWECAFDTLFDSVRAAYYSSDTSIIVPQSMSLNRGTYYWHVRAVDMAMNKSPFQTKPFTFVIDTTFVGVKEGDVIPVSFALHQNYPNPFNPTTKIRYALPVESIVRLKIYDLLGREVRTVVDEVQPAGNKLVEWTSITNSGASVASGVYFYRIEATSIANPRETFTQVKKLLLMR